MYIFVVFCLKYKHTVYIVFIIYLCIVTILHQNDVYCPGLLSHMLYIAWHFKKFEAILDSCLSLNCSFQKDWHFHWCWVLEVLRSRRRKSEIHFVSIICNYLEVQCLIMCVPAVRCSSVGHYCERPPPRRMAWSMNFLMLV